MVLSQLIQLVQFVFTWTSTKLEKEGERAEVGQGLVEYALLIVFIGVLMMGVLMIIGPLVSNMFRTIYDAVIDAST